MSDREKYERAAKALASMLPYLTAYPSSPRWSEAQKMAMECIGDAMADGALSAADIMGART